VIYLIMFLVMGMIGYAIGNQKGRPVEGFFAGLLLGVIGLIFIALRKPRIKCPECGGWIEKGIAYCNHCKAAFDQQLAANGILKKKEAS